MNYSYNFNKEINTFTEYLTYDISYHITKYIREELKLKAYLCGGLVRDTILGNEYPNDIDIFVSIGDMVAINNTDMEIYCNNILNNEFRKGIIKNYRIAECSPFSLHGNYIGSDFNFFVYEATINFDPFKYQGYDYKFTKLQIIFVNNSKYKSLLDVLRSFDIWLCRCGIDINGEVVILPECQKDIDNNTVTLQLDSVAMKSPGNPKALNKAKNRQQKFCGKYNFTPKSVNTL